MGGKVGPGTATTMAQPVRLTPAFASGETMTTTATGRLSMHGASRTLTLTVSGRRDGSALEIVGSIPVVFSDWRIEGPRGYGVLGSLADRGVAELRLVLHRG